MSRAALTIAACVGIGTTVAACGLLTGVDWDRVAVIGDGGSNGASGGTSTGGASGSGGTSGTSGTSGGPSEGGTEDGGCVPVAGKVCLPDGTLAPRCDSATCSGFGKCMTEPGHPLFNTCVPPTGSVVTACGAAANVSSQPTPEAGGPLIWGAQFVRGKDCTTNPTTQRGYSLTFSFFDAEDDGPDKDYVGILMDADFGFNNPPIRLTDGAISLQGNRTAGTAFMFPCVNANPLPAAVAFVLVDAQGHKSNPLCVTVPP